MVISVAALLASTVPPAAAAAEPAPGAAGWMYQPGEIVFVDLTLSPTEKAKLEADHETYVKGTFALTKSSDGTPTGEESAPFAGPIPVEIRLKGNVDGSYRPLSGKAAFKLKFKKSEPFLGLRKMTLNNMVEDRSLIHETLAYSVFRAAGVPSSRTGFAFVRLNGEPYGLYLNIENLDKVNLERWFGTFQEPPQHLYEGEKGADVHLAGQGDFEVDEGEESDRSDLEALISAVNASEGPGWSAGVSSVADLEEMTRMWAVEKYIGHWDGYSGREGEKQPNNYYLYSDPTGKFQMMPWGTDLTWEEPVSFDGPAGLLFNKCLADPACAALYRKQLKAVGTIVAGLDLGLFAEAIAEKIEPWWKEDPRLEYPALVPGAVAETLEFIADRPGQLEAWLAIQPAGEAGGGEPSAHSPSGGGTAPGIGVLGASRFGGLRIDRYAVDHGVILTRLRVGATGTATQRVRIRTASGKTGVCATREQVLEPGTATLHCVLSDVARRRLRARWLRLEVGTAFVTTDRQRASVLSDVVAHRDAGL